MPYTVAVSFDKFRENIEVTGNNREISTKRKDRIVQLLEKKFTILDAFPSGSIPRYTAVKGYADLDVVVVLHYGKHIKGKLPSEVLQLVRDALSGLSTMVKKNGQAVTLYYNSWPNVDIVPVSRAENNDGTIAYYEVPNMNDESWIRSKPVRHSNNMANRNKSCGEMFKRIIKMIKWWNYKHGSYLQSFHIEVLALNIFYGQLSDYSWQIYSFFNEAEVFLQSGLWYEGSHVDDYLTFQARKDVLSRLQTAKSKACDAWYLTYGGRNNQEDAIKIWRQIFGDKFPLCG